MELNLKEKEALGDILEKLRNLNDRTAIDNIKRFNFDILVVAIALNSKYSDLLIQIENNNKNRYKMINRTFRELLNKIF